jgi:hypothetical protein
MKSYGESQRSTRDEPHTQTTKRVSQRFVANVESKMILSGRHLGKEISGFG